MIKHRHHKIPKHAGGSDDASNIVELSIEDHAEAHRQLFEEHGRQEDRLAWQGLAGMIDKAELIHELQRLGGLKAVAKKQPWRGTRTTTNWAESKIHHEKALVAAWSQTARENRLSSFQRIEHQQGEKNSNYGSSVYRDVGGNRKRFPRGGQPDGWITSAQWAEKRKKKNSTYGKRWYNNSMQNFLLSTDDERVAKLKPGRLNPGFGKQRKPA